MAEQITHINININVQRRISENTDLKKGIIQKDLESINLGATNGTFVTKGEIESNFLTTLTVNKPKLNHWVITILIQLVIQFEPSIWCI